MQNDFSISNADGATIRSDVNSALQALATLSSGASAPSTTYAGQFWWDTTNNLVKIRNGANTAWVTVASWDGTTWIPYLNGASIATPSDTAPGVIEIAIQSEMEAGSSTVLAVTPGRQHFHPSAAKGWCQASPAGVATSSYNVTSVTDNGTGDATVTWATDFSSTAYCPIAGCISDGAVFGHAINTSFAAGVTRIQVHSDVGVLADPSFFTVGAFGDQA